MRILKQSTIANVMILLTSEQDHITGMAGLTPSVSISKNGGDFAAITPVVTDKGDGWYNIALTASDTDTLGDLVLHIDGGVTADPADVLISVSDIRALIDSLSQSVYNVSQATTDVSVLVDELHQLEGLKSGSPMTVTPTSRQVGSISLAISGNGETTTTVTRT